MLRRTLTILFISMLHAGCSTCSIWDECHPGAVQACEYGGCSDCLSAQETCNDNHEWGYCECIEYDEPDDYGCGWSGSWDRDTDDPLMDESLDWTDEDIAFDLPLDEELEPDTHEEDAEDAEEEDADLLDMEISELPEDVSEDGAGEP